MEFPSQDDHAVPVKPETDETQPERNNVRIVISIVLGALAFGIGGYPWGADQYGAGSSLLFLASVFFLITTYWGCVLGLLTGDLGKIKGLAGAGLIAGIVCLFIVNIGGMILIATIGWLLLIAPLLFIILIFISFKKGEKLISLAFFLLLIYMAVDWSIIAGINPFSTSKTIFSLHAFVYALTGIITGGCYGWVIGRIKTMAIFGLIGFSLGSYWIGIFYHLFESTENAVYGYIITYILVSIFAGIFLSAGLYYPQEAAIAQTLKTPNTEQHLHRHLEG